MKNLQTWIIIGLAVVIALLLLFDQDPPTVDLKPYETAVAIADSRIKELTAQNSTLLNKVSKDSIRQAENRSSFIREISGLKSRLEKQRVRIDTVLLENPEVSRYVDLADSTIQSQSTRIDSLDQDLTDLRVDLREITANFKDQIRQHTEKNQSLNEQLQIVKQENRKEKRKVKGWKTATVFGVVVSVWIASQ